MCATGSAFSIIGTVCLSSNFRNVLQFTINLTLGGVFSNYVHKVKPCTLKELSTKLGTNALLLSITNQLSTNGFTEAFGHVKQAMTISGKVVKKSDKSEYETASHTQRSHNNILCLYKPFLKRLFLSVKVIPLYRGEKTIVFTQHFGKLFKRNPLFQQC